MGPTCKHFRSQGTDTADQDSFRISRKSTAIFLLQTPPSAMHLHVSVLKFMLLAMTLTSLYGEWSGVKTGVSTSCSLLKTRAGSGLQLAEGSVQHT